MADRSSNDRGVLEPRHQRRAQLLFACTKAAATRMVRKGRRAIITVVGTIVGAAGQSAHAAAKAVLNAFGAGRRAQIAGHHRERFALCALV